jgi:3-oxo-5-alpha-steroid 4-dehydrogenase 3
MVSMRLNSAPTHSMHLRPFKCVSTLCSFAWLSQLLLDQSPWRKLAALTDVKEAMTLDQVLVTWILMLVQGVRRMYESLKFTRPSSARMWIGHWALGVWFYASMSVAVWIEGARRFPFGFVSCSSDVIFLHLASLLRESFEFGHLTIEAPSIRTFVGCLMFIVASGVQHDCHSYLASLKKYSLPEHPVFGRIVCPHYFVECVIYFAMSIVAAPGGCMLNWTIVCALVFVGVNLGVTADGSRDWYMEKFGAASMSGKWRMIPFAF